MNLVKSIASPFNALVDLLGGPSMIKFLVRRFLAAVPVVFAIMAVTFGLSHALPGGPFDANGQRAMPEHIRAQLEQRYGLSKPVFFNLPSDGTGSDVMKGKQAYVKGGFGDVQTGGYAALDGVGFAAYRDYDLYRWDEATQSLVKYEANPFKDMDTAAISTSDQLGVLSSAMFGTSSAAVGSALLQTESLGQTFSYANSYVQDCHEYHNKPGWSLFAKRFQCKTVGGTQDQLFNEVNHSYVFDPLDSQYWGYVWNFVRGDFGPSLDIAKIRQNVQVRDEVFARLPISMKLGLVAVIFGFTLGIPLGVLAAVYHNSPIDYSATFFAVLGASVPSIVLGPILLILFTVVWDVLPAPNATLWGDNSGLFDFNWELLKAMVLPVLALGTGMSAGIARLTRASLLQVLGEDYIRTARAKGLRERSVVYIHALKNSLIPVATILGPLLAGVLTGTFVIERIFTIPGLGSTFITSVGSRDYTTIMAVTVLFSVFLIMGNILVDVIYTWLDPRIRFD